jgi:hypothetical protein
LTTVQRRVVTRRRSGCLPRRPATSLDIAGEDEAVAGAAIRVAVGSVRGQLVRDQPGVRGVPADRDRRAARRPGRGVGAGRGGPGRGGGGGGAARSVGGVPPQAAGDGVDGPGPVRGDAERRCYVRVRLAQLRPAPGGVGGIRRRGHHLPGGQRRLPEGARRAGGHAGGERADGVHHLDLHRARAAARRRRDRAARPGDDRARRRGQLPAVRHRDTRHRRDRAGPSPGQHGPGRARADAGRRPGRRMAAHPDAPGAAPAVPVHPDVQRPDHGDRAAARGAHARPSRVRALAVRAGVRDTVHRRPDRLAAVTPAGGAVRGAPGPAGRRGAAVRLGALAGLHAPGRGRARPGHRRGVRADPVHRRVQPGARHLPARADPGGPGRPHAVRLDGQHQGRHRGPDRPVGRAGQLHRPPRRDHGGRGAPAGHPAAATPAPDAGW